MILGHGGDLYFFLLAALYFSERETVSVLLAPTAELNTYKNFSQRRYGKNLVCPILARKLRFLTAGYEEYREVRITYAVLRQIQIRGETHRSQEHSTFTNIMLKE